MKQTLNLEKMDLTLINENELITIDGGMSIWDRILSLIVEARAFV